MTAASAPSLHPNYRFVLDQALLLSQRADPMVLDYGCGAGQVVEEGRRRGMNVYGVEAFYEGADSIVVVRAKGMLNTVVFPLEGDRIPFPDNTFDVVVCNQVFEHVIDLERVLREIHRVLKTNGVLLALFPSRDVIREGHIGIPLAHWFPKGSRVRYWYTLALRSLGLGLDKGGRTRVEWTEHWLDWLDRFTFYRSYRVIRDTFELCLAPMNHIEDTYVVYRLRGHRIGRVVEWLVGFPPFAMSVRQACRSLSSMAFTVTKQ
jgi:SAM-dependent methyltransferase